MQVSNSWVPDFRLCVSNNLIKHPSQTITRWRELSLHVLSPANSLKPPCWPAPPSPSFAAHIPQSHRLCSLPCLQRGMILETLDLSSDKVCANKGSLLSHHQYMTLEYFLRPVLFYYFILFYSFLNILLKYSWLQGGVNFCCTAKWFIYTYTHIHSVSDFFCMLGITEYWVEFPVLYSRCISFSVSFSATWMDLEIIILCEVQDRYCRISLIGGS